jgi:hypothetical protein
MRKSKVIAAFLCAAACIGGLALADVSVNNTRTGIASMGSGGAASTIASNATIAPPAAISYVSGTAIIATITPPAQIALQGGTITLIPTGAFTVGTSGNVAVTTTAVVGRALAYTFEPGAARWFPSY